MRFFVVILLSIFIGSATAQTTAIPDPLFEQELINLGYDFGPIDGVVLTANIDTISVLYIISLNIADLTGIQDFNALTLLDCSFNQLTTLDLTQNTALTFLRCDNNQLTTLDVTQNSALTFLRCDNNQLPTLDVTQNTALLDLNCDNNLLTTIDVTQNILLTYFRCKSNLLTNIEVRYNPALNLLEIRLNFLISLDVTQNINLNYLNCSYNLITNLNLTQNIALTQFHCENNQLTCINLKNGNNNNILFFTTQGNPDLTCIEVDNATYSTINWLNVDWFTSFSNNCNSSCSVDLTILPPITICQGDSVLIFGIYQSTSNTYYDVYTNYLAYDSTFSQELIVGIPYFQNQNIPICQGDSILIFGSYENTAGVYIDSLQTILGCDSVLSKTISVNPTASTNFNQSICQGDSILINGNYENTSGIYIDNILFTYLGCDSIITINLTISPPTFSVINTNSCYSYTSPSNNYIWTTSGVYQDTIANSIGCDSIITINLIIIDNSYSIISPIECNSYSPPSGNTIYTNSGTYIDTLFGANMNGCDSIITINLTINSVDASVTNSFPTLSSNSPGSNYQWMDCNSMLIIQGDTNQSFTSPVTGSFAVIVTKNGCQDTSVCEIIFYKINITIPNTITPNGDGYNDYWVIKNIEQFPNHNIQVFNRNGSSVFSTTNYQNDWNGKYKGSNLPATTYYYVIDLGLDEGVLKGDLSIIRE